MAVFVASRWSGDDNAVFPDRLEIDDSLITYFKGTVVGYHKSIMPRSGVASAHVRSGLIFADIVIESTGGRKIVARGFAKRDAREIVEMLS